MIVFKPFIINMESFCDIFWDFCQFLIEIGIFRT